MTITTYSKMPGKAMNTRSPNCCKLYISVKQYKLSAEQGLLLSKRTIHTQLLLRIRNYSSLPQTLCLQALEQKKVIHER